MPEVDIPSLREKLLRLREEMEQTSRTSDELSDVVELDQARVGRLSRMDAMQAQAMSQAAGRRRQAMLVKIAAALLRMDKEEYGLCKTCEEAINPKRLEYDPTAVMCVSCAESIE
jgi:DnaK suppressor protein